MLTEIDRLLLATPDAEAAAAKWRDRLGAVEVGRDTLPSLGARRLILRAGTSDIEILEPDGTGAIEAALKRRGRAHLYAAGAASPDPGKVAEVARASGAAHRAEDGRHYLTLTIEGAPIEFVISPQARREPAGRIDFLYEATVLAADQAGAVARIRDAFGLDESSFTTITSETFGYTGVLTLFEKGRLHRFEVITPIDPDKTMGRYHAREGTGFYMAFAESRDLGAIERAGGGAGVTIDRPAGRPAELNSDQLWLHPPSLGGMMLGVSRPSMAWQWSGHPERVERIDP
ncbi:MAG TPA: hypothetical protein VFW47_04790 [Phenylobacterium sp.]|nr:hypothetical protein [Phenylobacterium sp.]